MSTSEPVAPSRLEPEASARQHAPIDAESLARRALGIAMNTLWGGAEVEPLPTAPSALVRDAQSLLRDRVPTGRERELALELLSRSAIAEPEQS